VAHEVLQAGIQNLLRWLDDEILRITREIRTLIDQDPDLKDKQRLLKTILGVGERTIAILLAFAISLPHFDNVRQAVAFAGLDPRQHDSGSSVYSKPCLSKVGHAFLRKVFYCSACELKEPNVTDFVIHAFLEGVHDENGHGDCSQ
jgi:transposase